MHQPWFRLAVLSVLAFSQSLFVAGVQLPNATSHDTATNATSHNIAAFAEDAGGYGTIVFAPTFVSDAGDLYFHFEAPAENSWGAVGIGSEMKGSLMLIFYRNETAKGITICSRAVDGNVEPSHVDNSLCDFVAGDGITNGVVTTYNSTRFVATVLCRNITSIHTRIPALARIELSDTQQPFIFALGPTDRRLRSNHKGVPIRRHAFYGKFKLDMSKATVATTSEVNQTVLRTVGDWKNQYAHKDGEPKRDEGGWGGTVHATLMCSTLVVLFPVGVVFLRLLDRVKPHAWLQGIGCVFIVCGVGVGIYAGKEYNQTKNISRPHQIIGLVVAGLSLVQFGLGLAHHISYKRHHRRTILGRIHVPLGSCILIAGAANGFVGFQLTSSTYHYIMYAAVVGFTFAGLAGALIWIRIVKKKEKRRTMNRQALDDGFEAYKHQLLGEDDRAEREGADDDAGDAGVMLQDMSPGMPPPEYSPVPTQPRPMV